MKKFIIILYLLLLSSIAHSFNWSSDMDCAFNLQLAVPIGLFAQVSENPTGCEFRLRYNNYEKIKLNFNLGYLQSPAKRFSDIKIILVFITPAIEYILHNKKDYVIYATGGISLLSEEVKAEAGENYIYFGLNAGLGILKNLKGKWKFLYEINLALIQDLYHFKFSIGVLYDFK
jgi:hypothetical protein